MDLANRETSALQVRKVQGNAGVFVDNQFLHGSSPLQVINPATEHVVHVIDAADKELVHRAVAAAKNAFKDGDGDWPKMKGKERAEYLYRIAKLVRERCNDLALLESLDNGKPYQEAFFDISDVTACFDYFAQQAILLDERQEAQVELNDQPKFSAWMRYEAVGVVGAVIPWNYPLLMAAWKLAPAFAAGCCVVLKSSENTPLTALEFAAIVQEAGLPAGVFNLLSGGPEVGAWLVEHTDVDKLAFTGSVPTGSKIMGEASKRICNVCLELGGKSPIIIFDDADMNQALEWSMFGCFFNSGQVCSATSRVLVQKGIADQFISKLIEQTQKIQLVDALDLNFKEHTGVMGPLVSEKQFKRVLHYIEEAKSQGAELLCGGNRSSKFSKGYFVEPTILRATPNLTIWKEEVFGPVMSICTFSTEEEAIRLANDTEFGLAGAVLSSDIEKCRRISRRLRCGILWINCSQPTFVELPWGGFKRSGIGRELGSKGIDNYLEPKQICNYQSKDPWGWYIH
jgi:betaine-aldehyde dehydrogenase